MRELAKHCHVEGILIRLKHFNYINYRVVGILKSGFKEA